jgi:hypothetical protein
MVICRGAVQLVSVYADRVPRRNERALRPYRSREINTEHENNRGLSIDFGLPTAWTTTRAAIHNHPSKHAAAADSKVELTWGDVRCHKYFQRTNLKNLSTSLPAQSAGLQRHQRSLERPSECAASKWSLIFMSCEPPRPRTLFPIPLTYGFISSTHYPIPYTLYPLPFTFYLLPFTLYPLPSTLYPIPSLWGAT